MKLSALRPRIDQRYVHVVHDGLTQTCSSGHCSCNVMTEKPILVVSHTSRIVGRTLGDKNGTCGTVKRRGQEVIRIVEISNGTPVAPQKCRVDRMALDPV